MFTSVESNTMMTVQQKAMKRQADDDVDEITDDELAESARDPDIAMNLTENTVKVKIVVSEIAQNNATKAIRRLISPVISRLDISPDMGLFHSALLIGPCTFYFLLLESKSFRVY
jgi:hypothetical protein